ncbi:hypothetical protein Tco_1055098 [Tanacetum coccineum]|uniref:Uncharacterized protein n=1 Tax=Tanacetum coccineum TaxID=301880 RepID=A0ABQ5GZW1_9ASTR
MCYEHRRLLILTSITSTLLLKERGCELLTKVEIRQDQLVSSCEMSKGQKKFIQYKMPYAIVPKEENLLHLDLCGPIRDETPEVLQDFLTIDINASSSLRKYCPVLTEARNSEQYTPCYYKRRRH